MRTTWLVALAASVMAAFPVLAEPAAGASPWAISDFAAVRLVASQTATGGRGTVQAGLQFRLEPDWKMYWRTPGDAGLPPVIDWRGSRNVADVRLAWPAPRRFQLYGLETFGYTDQVVLPLTVEARDRARSVALSLAVEYAVCKEICIPLQADLALDLPAGEAAPTPFAGLIAGYLFRVPLAFDTAGIRIASARASGADRTKQLVLEIAADRPFDDPDLIVEGPAAFYFASPEVALAAGGRTARFKIAVDTGRRARPLIGERLFLTLIDGPRAYESALVLAPDG